MTKLILRCGYAVGDIVGLTAAVRDLHRCYPGQFITDVRTSHEAIWEHNPYISKLDENDSEVWQIDCGCPLINRANEGVYHFLHGFIDFLNRKLRLAIKPTEFKGDIHLSALEKSWFSQVHEVAGKAIPFWIIAAGGKHDFTIKWWDTARYQQVVDHFSGKIQFVQVGGSGHHHPRLRGAIDLRGKTNLRELIRLVYHSQGILCSVTGLMHLAAAVEVKKGCPPLRHCVVISGGREPVQWEQYPGHQFIHTIGALPCCMTGGCWRDRVKRLRDGDKRDKPAELCLDVVDGLPRCMDMITSDEVIRRIQSYFDGGAARFLSDSQMNAAEKGIQATSTNRYDEQTLNLSSAALAFDKVVDALRNDEETPAASGRGIVICGGGVRYFVNAWVCINMLRRHGCKLPIEVWHLGKFEMSARMADLLASLDAETADASRIKKEHPMRILNGWELKVFAIAHSRFREILFLDADNVPVVNPEFLFDTKEFKETGAMFWPDLNYVSGKNAIRIWRSCGLSKPPEREFETGQMVIDKVRCWKALRLCLWLNGNSDFYYQFIHGDKETFHLAFRKLQKSYTLVQEPVHRLPGTMCQHDCHGKRIFQHRNMDKWDLFGNRRIEGFLFEEECLAYVDQLLRRWDGFADASFPLAPKRAVRSQNKLAVGVIAKGEPEASDRTLRRLRQTDWDGFTAPLQYAASVDKSAEEIRLVAELSLDHGADFILLLQGDLIFNSHLYNNILWWGPLRNRQITIASLYNPKVREFACDLRNRVRLVDPKRVFETQALMISAQVANILLKQLKQRNGTGAADFARIARDLKCPILFHAPSLVQRLLPPHVEGPVPHRAFDFDPDWRA